MQQSVDQNYHHASLGRDMSWATHFPKPPAVETSGRARQREIAALHSAP